MRAELVAPVPVEYRLSAFVPCLLGIDMRSGAPRCGVRGQQCLLLHIMLSIAPIHLSTSYKKQCGKSHRKPHVVKPRAIVEPESARRIYIYISSTCGLIAPLNMYSPPISWNNIKYMPMRFTLSPPRVLHALWPK